MCFNLFGHFEDAWIGGGGGGRGQFPGDSPGFLEIVSEWSQLSDGHESRRVKQNQQKLCSHFWLFWLTMATREGRGGEGGRGRPRPANQTAGTLALNHRQLRRHRFKSPFNHGQTNQAAAIKALASCLFKHSETELIQSHGTNERVYIST